MEYTIIAKRVTSKARAARSLRQNWGWTISRIDEFLANSDGSELFHYDNKYAHLDYTYARSLQELNDKYNPPTVEDYAEKFDGIEIEIINVKYEQYELDEYEEVKKEFAITDKYDEWFSSQPENIQTLINDYLSIRYSGPMA